MSPLRRCALTLTAILLAAQPGPSAANDEIGLPFYTVHGPEAWLGGAMVYVAARDSRGIVYFGTQKAVVAYDGVSWRRTEIPNGSTVRSLAIGPDDEVYVGASADFGVIEPEGGGYRSLAAELPLALRDFKSIWSINVGDAGVYFQSSESILLRHPDGRFDVWRPTQLFHKSYLLGGVLYVREVGRGLLALREGELELVTSSFADDGIYFMLPWDTHTALVGGNRGGLFLLDLDNGSLTRPTGFDDLNTFVSDNRLFHGVWLASGKLALSTLVGGVVLADRSGEILEHLQSPRIPLRGEFAHYLLPDGDNLWLALNNGVAFLETGAPLRFWDRTAGFRGTTYGIERYQGKLYFASGLAVFTPEQGTLSEVPPNMPAWAILRFRPSIGNERLLIGTIHGIFDMTSGVARLVTTTDSSGNVYGLYQAPDSDIVWVSTREGLKHLRWSGDRWSDEGYVDGLAEEVRTLHQDREGPLWVSLLFGDVARVVDGKVERFGVEHGLPSGQIKIASYDQDMVLLTEKGLYRFDLETGRFLPTKRFGPELADGSVGVSLFVPDHRGDIWLATTTSGGQRLERLRLEGESFVRETRPFARLPVMPIESLYPEVDGRLWVGGKEGIFRVDTSHLAEPSEPPSTLLRRVAVNGEERIIGPDLPAIPFAHSTLEFEWACPFPVETKRTLYRWRLDGYDETWSPWSSEVQRELSRLPAGRYTFRVMAKTFDNVETAAASQSFTIQPPWYQTWLARICAMLLLTMVIWGVVRLNVARLTRDKKTLEGLVEQRTEEIRQQARKLEVANRELKELDGFKRGLTGMIVHDLKNPLNVILNALGSQILMSQVDILKNSARQMLTMVLNILDVQKLEDAKMAPELREASLLETVGGALEQVAFLSSRKGISIESSIPSDTVVRIDSDLMERTLVNLLTNGIKYTPQGGFIKLAARDGSAGFVRIEVSDNGEGIRPEELPRVFERFAQVRARSSGGLRSTGLGLTFCKLAVEAQGGAIGVESEWGRGTTFSFTLPAGTASTVVPGATAPTLSDPLRKLVLSEDERAVLRPQLAALREVTVYDSTEVERLLEPIERVDGSLLRWKNEMAKALYAMNEERFCQLVELLEDQD